jgi:hypothetical protein
MIRGRELNARIDELTETTAEHISRLTADVAVLSVEADPLAQIIKSRFVVTLRGNEGAFSGILTETCKQLLTFEDCKTIPGRPAEQVEPIPGRVHVFTERIAYLQEM